MKEKIIIIGPGGSGKDYFGNFLKELGLTQANVHTTRPRRNCCDEGYIYITEEPLTYQYVCRFDVKGRDWSYFYSKYEVLNKNFMIIPPSKFKEICYFLTINDIKFTSIYFNIPESIRKLRLCKRNDGDYERRIETDQNDFKNFLIYNKIDIVVTDPHFDAEKILIDINNKKDNGK